MELEIDLSDLKESAVRRMLREAISREKTRSLPAHKRGKPAESEAESEEDDDSDEEHSKIADLAAEKGEPKPIPMTDEDMSEGSVEPLVEKTKKIGKPTQPPKKKVT